MAVINSLNAASQLNTYSSLFSSLGGNSSNSNSTSGASASMSLLSDWASIKNGSYGKLTRAYYNKNPEKAAAEFKEEANATLKQNNLTNSDASKLESDVKAIANNKDLFNKVKTKDADGNEVMDYDRSAIADAVKGFVKDYNAVLDSASESDNSSVLRNTLQMTNMTKVNSNMLSAVGIEVGIDNKLTVDEDKLKAADVNSVKSLFSGSGSYASSVGTKASNIMTAINYENNKLSNYTANGTYAALGMAGSLYEGSY